MTGEAPRRHLRVMVTGHRPQKLGGFRPGNPTERWVRGALQSTLETLKARYGDRPGYLIIVSGMALGVDQWWAEEALALGLPVVAAVPFEGQESQWPEAAQQHYRDLLAQCDRVEYVCDPGYEPWKMQARNVWMIDYTGLVVAVWDGSPGGTKNTVDEVMRRGQGFIHINPVTRTITSGGLQQGSPGV